MCLGSNLSVDENFVYKSFNLKNNSVNEILQTAIDREINFDKYVKDICKKAGNKLNTLIRIANNLNPFSKDHPFQIFHQRSIQLLSTFMDVLFTLVKQFD